MDNKKLYKRCKIISKMYNIPLYIAWEFKYNPYDIRYAKKHGIIKK